jgi:signal recognition particle subunit SRP54
MLEDYKRLAKLWSKMKIPKNGNIQQLIKNLPPQVLKQVGGMGSLQTLMKQMGGNDMTKVVGGMGLGGARPPSKRS